jgi:hypothetical protein
MIAAVARIVGYGAVRLHDTLGCGQGVQVVEAGPAAAVVVGVHEARCQHGGGEVGIRGPGRFAVTDGDDQAVAQLHPAGREFLVGKDHRSRCDEQRCAGARPGVTRQRWCVLALLGDGTGAGRCHDRSPGVSKDADAGTSAGSVSGSR